LLDNAVCYAGFEGGLRYGRGVESEGLVALGCVG